MEKPKTCFMCGKDVDARPMTEPYTGRVWAYQYECCDLRVTISLNGITSESILRANHPWSKEDMLVSGKNWSVSYGKETKKLVCSFNNEEADDDFIDSDGMVAYCEDCKRFFDVRSGCEKDIRADEREKLAKQAGLRV